MDAALAACAPAACGLGGGRGVRAHRGGDRVAQSDRRPRVSRSTRAAVARRRRTRAAPGPVDVARWHRCPRTVCGRIGAGSGSRRSARRPAQGGQRRDRTCAHRHGRETVRRSARRVATGARVVDARRGSRRHRRTPACTRSRCHGHRHAARAGECCARSRAPRRCARCGLAALPAHPAVAARSQCCARGSRRRIVGLARAGAGAVVGRQAGRSRGDRRTRARLRRRPRGPARCAGRALASR